MGVGYLVSGHGFQLTHTGPDALPGWIDRFGTVCVQLVHDIEAMCVGCLNTVPGCEYQCLHYVWILGIIFVMSAV